MKKTYFAPVIRMIDLETEGMIANSLTDGAEFTLSDEEVDTQMSNQKDMWGNESVWK